LIILGNSHLNAIADAHSLDKIDTICANPWTSEKDMFLEWLLTRYYIPYSILFESGWLRAFLHRVLSTSHNNFNFSWFSPLAVPERLSDALMQPRETGQIPILVTSSEEGLINIGLYSRTIDGVYSETFCARKFVRVDEEIKKIEIQIPWRESSVNVFRLDLSDKPANIILHDLRFVDASGNDLWVWDGTPDNLGTYEGLTIYPIESEAMVLIHCIDNDPRLNLPYQASLAEISARPDKLILSLSKLASRHIAQIHQNFVRRMTAEKIREDNSNAQLQSEQVKAV
jgi:hypothetical protein